VSDMLCPRRSRRAERGDSAARPPLAPACRGAHCACACAGAPCAVVPCLACFLPAAAEERDTAAVPA
jgi:hypothetical protein